MVDQTRPVLDSNIHPESVLGKDYETGEYVYAGCYGKVYRVYYDSERHSMKVLVAVNSLE